MSTATQGRAREHKVRDEMIAAGWHLVSRSAGSKGAADLVMVSPERGLALVQVGTGNKTIGPSDRARLTELAAMCGALPLLAQCAPRTRTVYWHVTTEPAGRWDEWWL